MPPRRRPRPPTRKQMISAYRAVQAVRRKPPLPKPKKPKVTFIRTSKPKPKKVKYPPSPGTALAKAAKIALKGVRGHFGI